MSIDELYQEIKNRRKMGESYQKIGDALGLSKPTVRRLAMGEKVGKKIKSNLEPSKKLQGTRRAQNELHLIARYWGYKSWSDYCTKTRRDFRKHFIDGKWID